ncbi:MAG: YeeE/YedE thiosulfate transporter family protein [Minicystis sp.]
MATEKVGPPTISLTGPWSPYIAGAGLGLIAAGSLAFFGRPLGASGAYQSLASYAGRAVAPESAFFTVIRPARVDWQAFVLAGVFLGALVAAALSRQLRLRWMPEPAWERAFGPSRARRWSLVFLGAFLVEIGAAIAGGCTSGLAVSGGVALAPGAFVFMAGMFATGIPTAIIVARRRRGGST